MFLVAAHQDCKSTWFGLRIPKLCLFFLRWVLVVSLFSGEYTCKSSSKLFKKAKFLQWKLKIFSVLDYRNYIGTIGKLISIANFIGNLNFCCKNIQFLTKVYYQILRKKTETSFKRPKPSQPKNKISFGIRGQIHVGCNGWHFFDFFGGPP